MSDGVTTEWHGDAALAAIDAATQAGLAAVGDFYVAGLRQVVSVPGPEASAPGEPPHKQTGELYEAIRWEVTPDGRGIEIVCDAPQGKWTEEGTIGRELGTAGMAPRPWFAPTIRELQPQAADVFAAAAAGAGPSPAAPTSAPSAGSTGLPSLPPGVGMAPRRGGGRVLHGLAAIAKAREAIGLVGAAIAGAGRSVAGLARGVAGWIRRRWK